MEKLGVNNCSEHVFIEFAVCMLTKPQVDLSAARLTMPVNMLVCLRIV